jgi:hypothetical protein
VLASYVESMRRVLTKGIGGIRDKLPRIQPGQVPISQQETVVQVQTLARQGIQEVMRRFDDVDVHLDDVLAM